MSKKTYKQADQTYIAEIHSKRKSGKSVNIAKRFGRSQYNQGGFKFPVYALYISLPGYESHVRRWEKLYKRHYLDYLEKHKTKFNKVTEWVRAECTEITCQHIVETMESYVRSEKLKLRRVKKEYLKRLLEDKNFIETVRADLDKHTDPV
jgi:hypothetical protein